MILSKNGNSSAPNRLNAIGAQLRTIRSSLLFVAAASVVFLGTVLVIHFGKGVRVHHLTSDPLAVTGGEIYIGFLSQVGIFFWAASVAICFFAASVIAGEERAPLRSFFSKAGLLSLMLGLDDVFQLHEEFFPSLGVPEIITYIGYAGLTLLWLIRFRSIISITEYLLLGAAFLLFGVSVGIDTVNIHIKWHYFLEDGSKFIGLLFWVTYFYRAALSAVR